MPFDEENLEQILNKKNLKKVSSQKSIFDNSFKKPTQDEFDIKVKDIQDRALGYKQKAAEYSANFKKIVNDKTLQENRSVFATEFESELLGGMVNLAIQINTDPNEQEGMGSLMWAILLLKTCLSQRDRINKLEYTILQLEKKIDPVTFKDVLTKEISKALDNYQKSE